MARAPVLSKNAPPPLPGILSQAMIAGNLAFCSGALPVDPVTGVIIQGDIEMKTHQCIRNLSSVLEAAGSSVEHVVKVNVFLTSIADTEAMNKAYMLYWGVNKPARSCVAVKELPRQSNIEIECVAELSGSA